MRRLSVIAVSLIAHTLCAFHKDPLGKHIGEQWWSAAQERLKNELVFFSWAGYPRWPGIVVAPLEKSTLLAGKGHFYPPDKKIFAETFVAARRGCLTLGERRYQVMRGGRVAQCCLDGLEP